MWMTDDYLRRHGLRKRAEIVFALPQDKMFGIPKYNGKPLSTCHIPLYDDIVLEAIVDAIA